MLHYSPPHITVTADGKGTHDIKFDRNYTKCVHLKAYKPPPVDLAVMCLEEIQSYID